MRYHETQIAQHQAQRLLGQYFRRTGENIMGDGVCLCRRAKWFHTKNPDTAIVNVVEKEDGRYLARMHDVANCGNGWLCPYCAGAQASHNSAWISELLVPTVKQAGLTMSLMTMTAWHRRDCDWKNFGDDFYQALSTFYKNLRRDLAAIGFKGRYRGMEAPIGPNGLHMHPHDLIVHDPGADMEAFGETAEEKWRYALKKYGLRCNKHGFDLKLPGTFAPCYVAKEIASTDSKGKSTHGLATPNAVLMRSARGDKKAGEDWLRFALAVQGRDRWNVGQLAANLGLPSPSAWKPETVPSCVINVITYPQQHHMHATSPSNPRPALAHIFNAAIRETRNPATEGRTANMALRMCTETITADIDELKHKHAHKLAKQIQATDAPTDEERQKMAAHRLLCWMQDVVDYKRATHARLFPAPPMLPLPPLWGPAPEIPATPPPVMLEFGQELEFT